MLGGVRSDGGVFGGFDAADADAGEQEPRKQYCPVRGVVSEADIRESEGGDADGEDATRLVPVISAR